MTAASPDIETLLDHQDWVRALARSLVADPSRADDVAQQTMLEAMRAPPRDPSQPKGWLATVARNSARAFARSEKRRARREQAVARDEAVTADPADAAHRATMHKRLVDELFELEEPYHTVLVLRFFDDLGARQIAAKLGRPVATVRTQLQRGLDRMRERLDREFGDRRAWCAALLPLLTPKQAVVSVPFFGILGALAMWKWILPSVAVIAALLFGLEFAGSDWSTPAPEPAPSNVVAAAPAATTETPADDPVSDREVVAAPAADAPAAGDPPPAPSVPGIRGRVVDADGRAVPGLTLVYRDPKAPRLDGSTLYYDNTSIDLDQPGLRPMLESDEGLRFFARDYAPYDDLVFALVRRQPVDWPRATTDGFGRFHVPGVMNRAALHLEGTDWIRYGEGRLPDEDDPVMVVGPGVRVAGRITDETGAPIEKAYVSTSFTLGSLPGIAQRFEGRTDFRSWSDRANAAGEFDLGVVPAHPALTVHAQKRQYVGVTVETTKIHPPVEWVLKQKPADERKVLSGVVLRADGAPAAKASVAFGQDRGSADESGRFEFALTYFDNDTKLTAHLPGLQPAIVDGLAAAIRENPAAGTDLVLRLGGEAREISGRVLDAAGAPRAGIRVMLGDGVVDGSSYAFLESAIGRQDSAGERTDGDGRFTLRGLSDRSYNVRAIDEETLLVIESGPVAAGTRDLELRTPADPFLPRLEGVIVDRHDNPVPGATLTVMTRGQRGLHGAVLIRRPGIATADESGRFVLENCPRQHVTLSLGGERVKWEEVDVPADGGPLRVVATRLLRFTVRVTRSLGADRFTVVDRDGERIASERHEPGVRSTDFVQRMPDGASPVYEVEDRAAELLLLDGEDVVGRVALDLRPGLLNEIEL